MHNGHLSPGIKFELHLAIKAKNNGHILLSSTDSVTMSDPVYEFSKNNSRIWYINYVTLKIKFVFNT